MDMEALKKSSNQRAISDCVDKMQSPKFYLGKIWNIQYLIYNIESTVKRCY
jgi:hypothetical protein